MTKSIRSLVVLAATLCVACSVGFAQSSGEATYKAKCQMCHGATGAADSSMAKMLKVEPLSDPAMEKLSAADMIKSTADGKGKMPAFKGKLTDEQIKDAVTYFRALK